VGGSDVAVIGVAALGLVGLGIAGLTLVGGAGVVAPGRGRPVVGSRLLRRRRGVLRAILSAVLNPVVGAVGIIGGGRRVAVDQRRKTVVGRRGIGLGPRRGSLEGSADDDIGRNADHGRPLALELTLQSARTGPAADFEKYCYISYAYRKIGAAM